MVAHWIFLCLKGARIHDLTVRFEFEFYNHSPPPPLGLRKIKKKLSIHASGIWIWGSPSLPLPSGLRNFSYHFMIWLWDLNLSSTLIPPPPSGLKHFYFFFSNSGFESGIIIWGLPSPPTPPELEKLKKKLAIHNFNLDLNLSSTLPPSGLRRFGFMLVKGMAFSFSVQHGAYEKAFISI